MVERVEDGIRKKVGSRQYTVVRLKRGKGNRKIPPLLSEMLKQLAFLNASFHKILNAFVCKAEMKITRIFFVRYQYLNA